MKEEQKKSSAPETETPHYTKQQLLACQRFRNRRDIMTAILEEDKIYTMQEAEQALSAFLKRRVK